MAPLRLLSTPPSEADYVPLSTHQAETPDSFYDGPPVLHLHQKGCVLLKTRSALEESRSPLASWWGPQAPSDGAVNGDGDAPELPLVRRDVDVLVASDTIVLTQAPLPNGTSASSETSTTSSTPRSIAIPYRAVIFHATQRLDARTSSLAHGTGGASALLSGVCLQLDPRDMHDDGEDAGDVDFESPELVLIPLPATSSASGGAPADGSTANAAHVRAMFDALSACADLWADPPEESDEDDEGGEWFFGDAEEPLGPGAGTRREREEDGDVGDVHMFEDAEEEDDEAADGDEAKWRRTG